MQVVAGTKVVLPALPVLCISLQFFLVHVPPVGLSVTTANAAAVDPVV